MNREQKRKAKKQAKLNKKLSEKIFLFDKMPDKCDACSESFDRKNKEMIFNWKVVVREKEEIVRLFCPNCCAKAEEVVKACQQK